MSLPADYPVVLALSGPDIFPLCGDEDCDFCRGLIADDEDEIVTVPYSVAKEVLGSEPQSGRHYSRSPDIDARLRAADKEMQGRIETLPPRGET